MAAEICCFCKRSVHQVTHLVQGPELFICDICVDACVDTLATKDRGWLERQIDYLLRLRRRGGAQSPAPIADPKSK
jgi:ATP-dependent protease Clp ATPase subunit